MAGVGPARMNTSRQGGRKSKGMQSSPLLWLSSVFETIVGEPPNEIHAHPLTAEYILSQFSGEVGVTGPTGTTICGYLKLVSDPRILPGVIYLDRDGEHTRNRGLCRMGPQSQNPR